MERRGHVRAEPPDRVQRNQAALNFAPARVRLPVRDNDARGARETGVLLEPTIPNAARIEVHFGGREAACGDAKRRCRRRCRLSEHHHRYQKRECHWLSPEAARDSGADGIRTHDPLVANQVLSQLSYRPPGTENRASRGKRVAVTSGSAVSGKLCLRAEISPQG